MKRRYAFDEEDPSPKEARIEYEVMAFLQFRDGQFARYYVFFSQMFEEWHKFKKSYDIDHLGNKGMDVILKMIYDIHPGWVYANDDKFGTRIVVEFGKVYTYDKELWNNIIQFMQDKKETREKQQLEKRRLHLATLGEKTRHVQVPPQEEEKIELAMIPLLFQHLKQDFEGYRQRALTRNEEITQLCSSSNQYWSTPNKLDLPEEIIVSILSYVHIIDLYRFCAVCREWFRIITNKQHSLAKRIIGTHFSPNSEHVIRSLIRFAPTIHVVDLRWFLSLTPKELGIVSLCTSLREVNLDHCDARTSVLDLLAINCPNLVKVSMENAFHQDPTLFFEKCTQLEYIAFNCDECDIGMDGITDDALQVLSEHTSGNIKELYLNRCTSNVTDQGMATLLRKCPKLERFVFGFEVAASENQDDPQENSETVTLLLQMKHLQRVFMTYISANDISRLGSLFHDDYDKVMIAWKQEEELRYVRDWSDDKYKGQYSFGLFASGKE
jgi:hypothetical protein